MSFAQLHEALRLEILRRIDRGVLSGSLLARQTGFKQAHISNFLRRRRFLSLKALDRVLVALRLTVGDLLAAESRGSSLATARGVSPQDTVPLVSQSSAVNDPHIAAHDVIFEVSLPPGTLDNLGERRTPSRRSWQRFVAIRVTALQAEPMFPILTPHGILVIDRHHVSLPPNRTGAARLYAVAAEKALMIRYISTDANRLVLRPYSIDHLIEVIDLPPGQPTPDFIVGRVCYILGAT